MSSERKRIVLGWSIAILLRVIAVLLGLQLGMGIYIFFEMVQ